MEATRQRALVRAAATCKKKKEKEKDMGSSSAPKDITKVTSKRKSEGKDNHPLKKGPVVPTGDKLKNSVPFKPSYRVGKGLMMSTSPVIQGSICCLLTHKEHVVEVIESIIKDTDMDPYAE